MKQEILSYYVLCIESELWPGEKRCVVVIKTEADGKFELASLRVYNTTEEAKADFPMIDWP